MPEHFLGTIRLSPQEIARMKKRERSVMLAVTDVVTRVSHAPRLLIPVFFAVAVSLSVGTSASFTDDTLFSTQSVGAGAWIPELEIIVSPQEGEEGVYTEAPCVTLVSTTPDTKVYYEFSDDGDPESGGATYGGGCLALPDAEEIVLQAVAVSTKKSDWRSAVQSVSFVIQNEEEEALVPAKKKEKKQADDEDTEAEPVVVPEQAPLALPPVEEPLLPIEGEEEGVEETVSTPLVVVEEDTSQEKEMEGTEETETSTGESEAEEGEVFLEDQDKTEEKQVLPEVLPIDGEEGEILGQAE